VNSPEIRDFTIEMENVSYRLPGGRALLDDVSWQLPAGETLVLIGRSGSGKTTLLRLINALLTASAGSIRVLQKNLAEWEVIQLRRRIGYVIQETGLFPHMTVEANVGLVPQLVGWEPVRIRERVREMLTLVGLDPDEFAARLPAQLSGGQRQRVGVARALAADPPLLLMDEPFGSLDPLTRGEMQLEFRNLQAHLGKSIVFVTHDIREAMLLGHRVALMSDGRLRRISTAAEFLECDDPQLAPFRRALGPVSATQADMMR
jgi:osmoprotectant transport system ATP-binding protein